MGQSTEKYNILNLSHFSGTFYHIYGNMPFDDKKGIQIALEEAKKGKLR